MVAGELDYPTKLPQTRKSVYVVLAGPGVETPVFYFSFANYRACVVDGDGKFVVGGVSQGWASEAEATAYVRGAGFRGIIERRA